ncbi:DNA repair protein RadC [Dickeya aquatica]|uniref:DNA repair protein RadC n=2 Tax=Pectobacteriaceae TaxID=1903410 RepID=A0A375A694_9GAMM|nr:DNA repair protein RadC [Dickeya aquatica]
MQQGHFVFRDHVMSELSPSSPLSEHEQRIIRRAQRLLERHLRQPGEQFTASSYTRMWLQLHLAPLEREVFMVLFLDNQHRLIDREIMALGSINHVDIPIREIVKAALRHNAAAVILAHNHPSGHAEPSTPDRALTERLKSALELVDIRTLDHLVIGGNQVVSFAERGWL